MVHIFQKMKETIINFQETGQIKNQFSRSDKSIGHDFDNIYINYTCMIKLFTF